MENISDQAVMEWIVLVNSQQIIETIQNHNCVLEKITTALCQDPPYSNSFTR